MALDKSSNFAKTTITGIASGATEVVLDDATNFLDPASGEYNCVIWEISNYGNPADDPNKEIVRATALSGNTLTITRAQESTIASNHNTSGETYAIANVLTKKMIDDIDTELDTKAIAPATNTANYIPQWDGTNSKTLKDGLAVPAGGLAGLTEVGGKLNLDQTTPQTITNGSPLFSKGVDMANNKWLKSKDYAGTGYLNILKGNEGNEVDVGTQLNVGSIEAEEDSGAISLFDMPVSSASADGTEMSATIKIDGNNILKIYAESDGAGGADTFKVQLLNKAVLTMQDSAGTTHTYTADTDGSLIIS